MATRFGPFGAVLLIVTVNLATAVQAAQRTWSDVSGKFTVDAELIEHDADQVILKKSDGEQITVPTAQLSAADRRFLATLKSEREPARDGNPKLQVASGVTLGEAKTYRVQIGMEITGTGDATGIVGIVLVPMEWPEQLVRVVETDKSPTVQKVSYRTLGDGARQMMIFVPRLRSGETARAAVTFEITRHGIAGPKKTGDFRVPQRLSRDMRHYLRSGPLTDAEDAHIVAAKDKAIEGAENAWQQVQAIHDWVLDNVRYEQRPEIKSASVALHEKVGDCQELSSLFVAMCRAHGVPARCVWIPSHSYAEFYLEDAAGEGHWFPVESTNKEQFGFLPRTEVILQKGDNFKVPEYREPLHYARTIFKAADVRGGQPEFKEIFELLPATQTDGARE